LGRFNSVIAWAPSRPAHQPAKTTAAILRFRPGCSSWPDPTRLPPPSRRSPTAITAGHLPTSPRCRAHAYDRRL